MSKTVQKTISPAEAMVNSVASYAPLALQQFVRERLKPAAQRPNADKAPLRLEGKEHSRSGK
jgi:hypothetical protein